MSDDVLTPERLTPLFEEHLGTGAAVSAVSRAAVGNGQESWFVDLADGRRFVLRRTAVGGTLEWTDRAGEVEVLRSLAGHGLPVPVVRWFEDAPSSLERAYFVMDRLPGAPFAPRDATPQLAAELGAWLARLHRAAPADEAAVEGTRRELAATVRRATDDPPSPVPVIGALLGTLERTLPDDGAQAVRLWGDPGPHNVLVADGSISALLDWELTRVGHPLDDLGGAVWSVLGFVDPELVVEGYEREAGAPVDRTVLRWFEALAEVSRSVMTLAGTSAFLAGRNRAPNLAGLGLALVNTSVRRAVAALWDAPLPTARVAATPEGPAQPVGVLTPQPSMRQLRHGVASFLHHDVVPGVADRRLASGLKIAAALLALDDLSSDGHDEALRALIGSDADEPGAAFEACRLIERDDRHRHLRAPLRTVLVEHLDAVRARLGPLLDLYGPTTAFPTRRR